MFYEQWVFTVGLVLEARFLLHRIVLAETRRLCLIWWLYVSYKDKWLENRPEQKNNNNWISIEKQSVLCDEAFLNFVQYVSLIKTNI